MAAAGCYLTEGDIDNWPVGYSEAQKQAVIDKVEQWIDKVTGTYWCGTAFNIKLNGNGKNRLFIPLETDILTVTSVLVACVELDSSWWEYDINSIFLDPCIGDSLWGTNAVTDGDFYSWQTADPTTDLYYWIETLAGTSTLNRDTVEVQVGNYCVRLDIDALNSTARFHQRISLYRNRDYNLHFWYMNSVAAKTAKYMLYNADKNESLQGDGTWAAGQIYVSLANVVAWTEYSNEFTSHPDFATYDLYFENDAAASSSIYFDNVGILTAGIAALIADIEEAIFPRGFNNVQAIGTMGENGDVPEPIKNAAVILAKWLNDPTLYTSIAGFLAEKIGDYSYAKYTKLTVLIDVLTGVMEADIFLMPYVKNKAILMAP